MDRSDRTGIPQDDAVRAFVEEFIALRAEDPALDPARFCERCPEPLQDEVQAQCLAFLVFGRPPAAPVQGGAAPTPGTVLQDFVLEGELGRGGMGIVYRARHVRSGELVAVKVLPGVLAASPRSVESFRREAAAVARLQHPGIVQVHAAGTWQGTWFFAMDLVEGRSLRACLDERRALPEGVRPLKSDLGVLPGRGYVAEVAELVAQVALALHYAHEQGVIHRDVKPQNILIDRKGAARLVDFGLAKDLDLDTVTLTGELKGTPVYMSPEQVEPRGRGVDRRTDLYSLGVVLYEALTLRRPFEGGTVQEVLRRILFADPPRIDRLSPGVPRNLQTICFKALEKDPRRRYRSGSELADDLRRFLRHEPIRALPASPVRRVLRRARRHRALTAAAASVAVFSAALAVWLAVDHARLLARTRTEVEQGDAAHAAGRLDQALEHIFRAATLRPDDPRIEQKLETWQELSRREQEHRRERAASADSLHLLYLSSNYLEAEPSNPGVALLLALEASRRTPVGFGSRALVHNALLAALRRNREVRTLVGHRGAVVSVGFGGGGSLAVTAAEDSTARVWETVTGRELRVFTHSGKVHAAALSPDGTLAAAACADGTVRLWEVAGGTERPVLAAHAGPVRAVRFDGEGRLLATGSEDGTAAVWELAGGKRRCLLRGHTAPVRCVAFDRAGRSLLTTSEDETFRTWDLATGELAYQSRPLKSPVVSGEFSPDGQRILLCSGYHASIWNLGSKEFDLKIRHDIWVVGGDFHPDGRRIATAAWDRIARVFDVLAAQRAAAAKQIPQPLFALGGHRGELQGIRFSPDGRMAITPANDGTARIWNVDQEPAVDLFRVFSPEEQNAAGEKFGPIASARFSGDGGRLVLSSATTGHARVRAAATGDLIAELPLARDGPRLVAPAEIDPTGNLVLAPAVDGSARIFSLSEGKEIVLDAGQPPLTCAVFDPTGTRVATSSWDGKIRVFAAADGKLLHELSDPHARFLTFDARGERLLGVPHGRYFTPDGKAPNGTVPAADGSHEYLIEGPSNVTIWNLVDGSVACRVAGEPVTAAVASPAFDRLLVTTRNRVLLTDVATRTTLASFPIPICLHAAFSADGAAIVLALFEGVALLCDGRTGERVATLTGHVQTVGHAAFSADGTRVVTASFDGTARIWDAQTGDELCTLRAEDLREARQEAASPPTPRVSHHVVWATFSPSGNAILTLGEDGFARSFPADPVQTAQARRPRELTAADRGLAGRWLDAFGSPVASRPATSRPGR